MISHVIKTCVRSRGACDGGLNFMIAFEICYELSKAFFSASARCLHHDKDK